MTKKIAEWIYDILVCVAFTFIAHYLSDVPMNQATLFGFIMMALVDIRSKVN